MYLYLGWPPGGTHYRIWILDGDSTGPDTFYYDTILPPEREHWLPTPIYDDDGLFFVFWIQVGNYPNCFALAEDQAQEDTIPDWYYAGHFGHGFPRNDFLIRVYVNRNPRIGESTAPQPFLNLATLTNGNLDIEKGLKITIYDATGRRLRTQNFTSLPTGIYFVKIEREEQSYRRKIIIIH